MEKQNAEIEKKKTIYVREREREKKKRKIDNSCHWGVPLYIRNCSNKKLNTHTERKEPT